MGSSVILPSPGQPKTGPDEGFTTGSIPSAVSFLFDGITPPAALFVQQDDQASFNAISSLAAETVTFRVRFLHVALPIPGQPDTGVPQTTPVKGKIPPYIGIYEFPVVVTAARTFFQVNASLGEGFVLSIEAQAANATTRGVTFARAELFRGPVGAKQPGQLFLSDYVSFRAGIAFPGNSPKHYVEGPGVLKSILVPNPAAGADWVQAVPTNARWRAVSFSSLLTASAGVANRQAGMFVDDGSNVYWATSVPTAITAGQAVVISATSSSAPQGAAPLQQTMVFPPNLYMPGGHRLRSATVNLQAADQYSQIVLMVEEWIDF